MSVVVEDKRPDEMGVWSDGGETVWLSRDLYPKRSGAIQWAVNQWLCDWTEVSCLSRWMRYTPHIARDAEGNELWRDDLWSECEGTDERAFSVWRLESR